MLFASQCNIVNSPKPESKFSWSHKLYQYLCIFSEKPIPRRSSRNTLAFCVFVKNNPAHLFHLDQNVNCQIHARNYILLHDRRLCERYTWFFHVQFCPSWQQKPQVSCDCSSSNSAFLHFNGVWNYKYGPLRALCFQVYSRQKKTRENGVQKLTHTASRHDALPLLSTISLFADNYNSS